MPEFDWASAVDVPEDRLLAGVRTQMAKDISGQIDIDEIAKRVDEINREYAKKRAFQEDLFASLRHEDPEAEAAAMPKGQRPTTYDPVTRKFVEVDPTRAAEMAIPLGRPRTTGEHAPEGGVIFSAEPWKNFGASNEPGVPSWYTPPSQEESDRQIRAEQLDKEPEIRGAEAVDTATFDWSSAEDVKPQENAAPTPAQGYKTPYGEEQEKLIGGMREQAQPYVRKVLEEANKALEGTGIEARLKEGYRTPQQQDELYAQGRTKPGEIITNARAGQSKHQSGLAMDIGLYKDGQYIDDPKDPAYKKLGPIAKQLGLTWGGDFKSLYDPEHLEVPPGAPKLSTETRKAEAVPQTGTAPETPAAPAEFDFGSAQDVKPGDFDWGSAADPKTQPVAKVTAYRPGGGPQLGLNSAIEGGINDAHDTPILGRTTMEDYQNGIGPYVTVAMDKNSPWQDHFLQSPNYPGVVFRVRDNGAYGNGKTGENWVDIAYTDPEKAKHMLLRDVPFSPITPEAAQTISANRPNLLRTPDLLNAPDLKDITPAVPEKREVGFGESFSRENAREILGMGESLNRLVASPLLQGASEAAKAVVPDSPIAKFLDKANKDWQTTMVDAASSMRKSLEIDPNTEVQGLKGEAGGMIGKLFPDLLAAYVTPGAVAVKFILPAVTEGMDAMKRAREKGAPPWQQLAQFAWGFAQTEAFVNLPLHVQSAAIKPVMRFLERTTKATLVAGGAHEALRDINNIIAPIIGTEQQPFDWKALAKVALPMGVFGGVAGGDARTRPQEPIAEQAFPKTQVFQDHTVTPPAPEGAMPGGAVNIPAHGPRTEAFHGSPFEFEAFDTSKIGSGEGAQAFGYGHYVAERKGIGKSYAESVKKVLVDGKPVEPDLGPEGMALKNIAEFGYDEALKNVEDDLAWRYSNYEQGVGPEEVVRFAEETLAEIKKLKGKDIKIAPGNLYRVHVKGDQTNFLDWDKPLSEQSEDVQHALKDANLPDPLVTGANAYHYLEEVGRQAGEAHGAKAASEWLSKRGVLGIRFLDQPSRDVAHAGMQVRQTENGWGVFDDQGAKVLTFPTEAEARAAIAKEAKPITHNLVVFDPKNIEILDRNGKKLGTMAAPPPDMVVPTGDERFAPGAPQGAPAEPPSKVAEALSGIPPKTEAPTGEERFAPGAPKGEPYQPVPEEAGAGVGLVASPKGVTAAGEVKEAAKAIAKEATTLKKTTDFVRALKVYVANRGEFNQRLMKVRKELDGAWKPLKLTAKQIKIRAAGVTNYIQAGGDRNLLLQRAAASKNLELRKGYEAGANLTPAEVEIANKVRQNFADYLVKLRAAGVDVTEFENYVTQMWQAKLNEHAGTGIPRILSDYFKFRKERFFKNYFEGEQAGQIPKTKDIREIMATYMHTADTVINNRKLVADLLKGKSSKGDPLLLNPGGGRFIEPTRDPKTGEIIKDSVTMVFPEAKPKDAPEGVHYERMNFPALRKWKYVASDSAGNPILMHGDLDVHPEIAQHLKNIFGQSWIHEYWNTPTDSPFHSLFKGVTRFAFNDAQQYFKGTMFTLSGFHQFQETIAALSQRVLPGRIGKGLDIIDLENNPKQMDAARHGLMLAPDRVASTYFNEGMMGEKNLVTLALRHIGEKYGIEAATKGADTLKWYNDYLFHEFIPGLKYKTYEESLVRNLDRFKKELANGTVTPEQVKSLTADQVNATFGHLNKDIQSIGSNKTIQHILQMLLIAPDFGEARVRHAGQAFSGLYSRKGREQFQGLLLGAGVAWAGARILNLLTDGDPHFEGERLFEVKVGNRWLGFRSTYEDIWRAFGGVHGFANRRGFGQFISNRLSPFSRTAGTYLFGYNWRGESTEQIGLMGLFKDLLFGVVPLPIQGLTNKLSPSGKSDPIGFWGHLANAFGIQVHRFSPTAEFSQAAREWQRTYEPENEKKGTFGPSKYIQLQYAIEDGDKNKALAEIQGLKDQKMTMDAIKKGFKERMDHPFTSSNASDAKFRKSLSAADRKKFDAAVKYKQEILKKFYLWAPVR